MFEWNLIVRILCAALTGTAIGSERRYRSKKAGTRTHAIVCTSAALLMILSKYGFADTARFDASRIAAQVVSGVGFLGAGMIFINNDNVQGLTTASGIWATAAIGLAYGAGMYGIALATTIMFMIIQVGFQKFHSSHTPQIRIKLSILMKQDGNITDISECLWKSGYAHNQINLASSEEGYMLLLTAYTYKDFRPSELIEYLNGMDSVIRTKIC